MGKYELKLKKKEQKLKYKLAKKRLKSGKSGKQFTKPWYKKLLEEGLFQIAIKVVAAFIAAFILWKLGMK